MKWKPVILRRSRKIVRSISFGILNLINKYENFIIDLIRISSIDKTGMIVREVREKFASVNSV